MIVKIPGVLSADQVAACAAQLAKADWRDGKSTAGPQSARVKANEQVFETCPIGNELGRMVVAEIERNQVFLSAALPRQTVTLTWSASLAARSTSLKRVTTLPSSASSTSPCPRCTKVVVEPRAPESSTGTA